MRGQVTIEFILVLVVVLVILATISMPTIDRMEQDITDVGTVAGLAAARQQIVNTAEEIAMAGCGSRKLITVFINGDPFSEPNLKWGAYNISGSFFFLNGTAGTLNDLAYPEYVDIDAGDGASGYWNVTLSKLCTHKRPGSSGCIGDGC